jgi:aminoglycoside phosphotransferase (APT) family kinase protein
VAPADLASRLLDHLRAELRRPALAYAEPPVPIRGGYDTEIFAFRLEGGAAAWAHPLILRLMGPQHDPRRAIREQVVQNTVAGLGFPAPPVLAASGDPAVLGGGFLVMRRLPGRPLLEERRTGIAAILVPSLLALHALDADRLLEAMDAAGGRSAVTFDGLLGQLRDRIARGSLDGLRAAIDWLVAHRPRAPERAVICHGDFHPQNVLVANGIVTGVLDWPNAVVADAAYDVASSRIILGLVPLRLSAVPPPLRALVRLARPLMLARFLAGYRRRRALDAGVLAYYEAASCVRLLVRVAECRLSAAAGQATLGPLDASAFGERLCARFAAITGVRPAVPAVPD